MQKEVLPLHKLQDHAYEQQNPFGLKEYNSTQRNCQNQSSHLSLSHIEQGCQGVGSRKDSHPTKFDIRPNIAKAKFQSVM